MASERVGDMTLKDLTTLIEKTVEERFVVIKRRQVDSRSTAEILASIDEHMWTPPPGAKSSLELLREDRDR